MICPYDGGRVVPKYVGTKRGSEVAGYKCTGCGAMFPPSFVRDHVLEVIERFCDKFDTPLVTKKSVQKFDDLKVDPLLLHRALEDLVRMRTLAKYGRGRYIFVRKCGDSLKAVVFLYGDVLFGNSKKVLCYMAEDGRTFSAREVEGAITEALRIDAKLELLKKWESSTAEATAGQDTQQEGSS